MLKRLQKLLLRNTVDTKKASLSLEGKNDIGNYTKIRGTVTLGYCTTLGGWNQIIGGHIRIGRYCQVAPFVAIYALNHPLTYLTTYVNSRLSVAPLKDNQIAETVIIGNDVWIGHGAIILPGVTIGDGSIIGAGAVVTRDVSNYSVAAGNPARIIKQRFSPKITDELLKLKWWESEEANINDIKALFEIDLRGDEERVLELIRSAMICKRRG